MKGQHATPPRKGGRSGSRLSDAEKVRRATRRLARLTEQAASATDAGGAPGGTGPDDPYEEWLVGLSELAHAEGRRFLDDCIPGDRDAFQRYLEHRASWIRRYPLRDAPLHEKVVEQEEGTRLLEAVRWRWRR
jgi:hypothetical protein